jgi:hypothetical protein
MSTADDDLLIARVMTGGFAFHHILHKTIATIDGLCGQGYAIRNPHLLSDMAAIVAAEYVRLCDLAKTSGSSPPSATPVKRIAEKAVHS